MVANRRLAEQRGISEEECLEIDKLHNFSETIMNYYLDSGDPFNTAKFMLTGIDFELQRLWRFPQDEAFHTLYKRYDFKCLWAGRQFRCKKTGSVFKIPNSVTPKDFYGVGDGFIDVGDGYYCRFGGAIEEIEEFEGGYKILIKDSTSN